MNQLLKKKIRFRFDGVERSGLVVLINRDTVSVDLDEMIRYRDGFATRVTVKPSDIISVEVDVNDLELPINIAWGE